MTPELYRQIAAAIEVILPPHREPPDDSIVVADPSSAFDRIQDWAFCEGYAFVKASANAVRYQFDCIYHKNETRNTRKLKEQD